MSSPRVANPTARCAIGDTLITTGEPVTTLVSFHRSHAIPRPRGPTHTRGGVTAPDLTAELYEGYRQTLWIPPESPECSPQCL
ncbi:hypothetical protein C6W93_02660 [Mycobacterium kansasii]|nr:hypothetical protein [Mycobacterium kansasii]